jgi:hypothetical protein
MAVDPGFRAEHVLAVGTRLPKSAYVTGAEVRAFYERLLSRTDALPGVRASGASVDLPLSVRERRAFTIENQPAPSAGLLHVVAHEWTMGRYFEAMGVRLIRGRFLAPSDDGTSERVVVINETLAQRFWGDGDPIDQRLAWGGPRSHGPWMRIVGIVGDVKQGPLTSETVAQTYQPWAQAVADTQRGDQIFWAMRELQVTVRSDI